MKPDFCLYMTHGDVKLHLFVTRMIRDKVMETVAVFQSNWYKYLFFCNIKADLLCTRHLTDIIWKKNGLLPLVLVGTKKICLLDVPVKCGSVFPLQLIECMENTSFHFPYLSI